MIPLVCYAAQDLKINNQWMTEDSHKRISQLEASCKVRRNLRSIFCCVIGVIVGPMRILYTL